MAFITPTPVARVHRSSQSAISRRPSHLHRSRPTRPSTPRMIATEPQKTATQLSPKARELLSYVRGHKSIFHPGRGFNSTRATLFRKNDTAYALTPLDELATNAKELPGGSVAAFMLVQEEQVLQAALDAAYQAAPQVKTDDTLNEILTVDLRAMIRVVSYGVACKSTDFIHPNNLGMMKMLHQEVSLPSVADVAGLNAAKDAVIAQITDNTLVDSTAACFDVVIEFMS